MNGKRGGEGLNGKGGGGFRGLRLDKKVEVYECVFVLRSRFV